MSCRHKNIVVVGSHETGASSARCADCRAPLTRRIEGGEYIYTEHADQDADEVVHRSRAQDELRVFASRRSVP